MLSFMGLKERTMSLPQVGSEVVFLDWAQLHVKELVQGYSSIIGQVYKNIGAQIHYTPSSSSCIRRYLIVISVSSRITTQR